METIIPTAEQLQLKQWRKALKERPDELTNVWIREAMIEFAKLHVQAALKAASNSIGESFNINEDLFTNAYPLSEIK